MKRTYATVLSIAAISLVLAGCTSTSPGSSKSSTTNSTLSAKELAITAFKNTTTAPSLAITTVKADTLDSVDLANGSPCADVALDRTKGKSEYISWEYGTNNLGLATTNPRSKCEGSGWLMTASYGGRLYPNTHEGPGYCLNVNRDTGGDFILDQYTRLPQWIPVLEQMDDSSFTKNGDTITMSVDESVLKSKLKATHAEEPWDDPTYSSATQGSVSFEVRTDGQRVTAIIANGQAEVLDYSGKHVFLMDETEFSNQGDQYFGLTECYGTANDVAQVEKLSKSFNDNYKPTD